MKTLLCEDHGCVYAVDNEGTLLYTPLLQDNTFDDNDWIEVDHMALLGEEQYIQDLITEVHNKLLAM